MVCFLYTIQQVNAQVTPAVIIEDVFIPGYIQDVNTPYPSHSNAHSHGELVINGVNSDLYSFTWDHGDGFEYGDGGMVVRQYAVGTTVDSSTTPLYEDFISMGNGDFPNGYIRSLESGIFREGGETYILLSYFKNTFISPATNQNEYYLDLYSWGGVTGLTLISSTVLDDIGDEPFGWIHQDVNNLTDFVITWEYNGQIRTLGGNVTGSNVQMGGIGYLDNSLGVELKKPDVAMMKDWNGEINLYYVFTNYNSSELYVAKANFMDLVNITPLNIDPLSCDIINVVSNGTKFDLPRIDAPDNSMYNGHEAWSFVVAEHTGTQDLILAHIFDASTGSINSQYLNGGSLVTCPQCDISPTVPYDPFVYNTRAVVAFSNNETDVYYGWCFGNPTWIATNTSFTTDATYLSVKVDLDFNLLNSNPNPNQYFAIPNNNNTLISPSMAFSTQNDASPYLFTTFFQWPKPFLNYEFFIGLKTVDWSMTTGFKPEPTSIVKNSTENHNIEIFPNPFNESFSIELNGINENTICEITIYDILGRLLYSNSGTIKDLNKNLIIFGKNIPLGSYYLSLKAGKLNYNKILLKQ